MAGVLDDGSYTKEDLCLRVSDVSHICVKYKQPWWSLPSDGMPRIKGAAMGPHAGFGAIKCGSYDTMRPFEPSF